MLDLGHALLGEDGSRGPLYNVRHAVELGGLAAQPGLVQVHALPFQLHGHQGIAAAGAGKAGNLGEGADLDGAGAGTFHLKDAAGLARLGDKTLIGSVKQDDRAVGVGKIHPLLQLGGGVHRAGGVGRAADINDIRLLALVGHGQETVFLPGLGVDHPAAVRNVVIHIGGVDGVRHQDGIVLAEQAQNIGQVALGAVADEDLIAGNLYTPLGVIVPDGVLQERIALLGAVAVEALGSTHLVHRLVQRLDHRLCQGQGHIANAQPDDLPLGMGGGKLAHLLVHRAEQIALGHLGVMTVHLHILSPPPSCRPPGRMPRRRRRSDSFSVPFYYSKGGRRVQAKSF